MSAIDIGHIMLAAIKGDHIFSVEFANLGILEFHQVVFLICFIFKLMLFSLISFVLFIQDPDPKYFNIEGENGFFKARKRPYKRDPPLELYGYDLYDAFQWSKKGILVYSANRSLQDSLNQQQVNYVCAHFCFSLINEVIFIIFRLTGLIEAYKMHNYNKNGN